MAVFCLNIMLARYDGCAYEDKEDLLITMKSYIHFIRHGKTEGTERRLFYGWTDFPLLSEGVTEIKSLASEGLYPPLCDADCYTSGMLRAEQTFDAIYGDVPHKQIPALKEINFGRWEAKTVEELKGSPEFIRWETENDGTMPYPDGESFQSFAERIKSGLKELTGYHSLKELSHRHSGQDAISIMVCHGGVISATMHQMFPNVMYHFFDWVPEPGHGYTVYFEDGKPASYEKF